MLTLLPLNLRITVATAEQLIVVIDSEGIIPEGIISDLQKCEIINLVVLSHYAFR